MAGNRLWSKTPIAIGISSLLLTYLAYGETQLEGYAGLSATAYSENQSYPDQYCRHLNTAITLAPRLQYWNDSPWSANLSLFYQWDTAASVRYGDVNEANATYNADSWSVLLGMAEVYWGVTEVYQPNNIVNQYDGRRGLGFDEKIGQAMVHYQYWPEWGEIHAFLLPWHRARPYRKTDQRLSLPKSVDDDP
ncbi:MAG: hypothetical protein ACR2PX_11520 [Endozoicomonas sp.]|uniref:hypothetical protein n=1 Tax=Endozoicomonas sp. TaxID=1892382 RepID=UPI003D9B091D